ncbi:hypothetical protein C8Q76DRAFT_789689 [Earliella scabrosa]|nr:hypothetical protein C8Q76DRAFT_789689 [Earliella scabrosa]
MPFDCCPLVPDAPFAPITRRKLPQRAAASAHDLLLPPPFDAHHDFVTSPVFSPLVLAILRLTLATSALFVALYHLIYDTVKTHDVDGYSSYFTHLSYIGLIAYLYAAGVQTLCYALKGKSGYPLQRWPRPLQLLHPLLYSTVTTYPLVVTVIYWALLSSAATFEIVFSLPQDLSYSFLDPGKQRAKLAGYIIAVGVAVCLAFVLVRGLTWARNRLSKRNVAPAPDSTESIAERQPSEDWEQFERPSSSIAPHLRVL